MIDFIEIIDQYSFVTVVVILVLFFGALKSVIEGLQWIDSLIEKWRQKENGQEEKERTIEERLESLEEHNKQQDTMIRNDDELIQKIAKSLDKLSNEFHEFKMNAEEKELNNWIEKTRWNIISSATRISNGDVLSEDQLRIIFNNYTEYEKVLKEHNMTNGECEISMDIIRDYTRKRIMSGSFNKFNEAEIK